MLVLTRSAGGEGIRIFPPGVDEENCTPEDWARTVRVVVTQVSGFQVRIGIDAPGDVRIQREELLPDRLFPEEPKWAS